MPLPNLTIDPEFRDLIPAMSEDEKKQLEANIVADGCLHPIIVWANHNDTILDGHHRYEICKRLKIDFKTKALKFDTREDAKRWLLDHQLGRRNLTDAQRTYLLGERYLLEKHETGRPEKSGQSDQIIGETAGRIAEEHGVGEKTVRRAAEFTEDMRAIGEVSPEAKQAILAGDVKSSHRDVAAVAELPKADQRKVARAITSGKAESVREALKIVTPPEAESNGKPKEETPEERLKRLQEPYRRAVNDIGRIQKDFKAICDSRAVGAHFAQVMPALAQFLKDAKNVISENEPHSTCNVCDGKKCAKCKHTGFITRCQVKGLKSEGKL